MKREDEVSLVGVLGWFLVLFTVCVMVVLAQAKLKSQTDTVQGLLNSVECKN